MKKPQLIFSKESLNSGAKYDETFNTIIVFPLLTEDIYAFKDEYAFGYLNFEEIEEWKKQNQNAQELSDDETFEECDKSCFAKLKKDEANLLSSAYLAHELRHAFQFHILYNTEDIGAKKISEIITEKASEYDENEKNKRNKFLDKAAEKALKLITKFAYISRYKSDSRTPVFSLQDKIPNNPFMPSAKIKDLFDGIKNEYWASEGEVIMSDYQKNFAELDAQLYALNSIDNNSDIGNRLVLPILRLDIKEKCLFSNREIPEIAEKN